MLEVCSDKGGIGVATTLVSVITESLLDRVQDHSLVWLINEMSDGPLSFGVSPEEGVLQTLCPSEFLYHGIVLRLWG